jgi:hypothetical protein
MKNFFQHQDIEEDEYLKEKLASFDIELYKKELEIGFLRLENDLLIDSVSFFKRQLDWRKA